MTVPPPVSSYDVDEPTLVPAGAVSRAQPSADAGGEWLERNGRTLAAAAVIAAVAVAGAFAWRQSNASTAARADRALYEAEARYAQGDPGAGAALQQVTSRYADTPAAAHARVLLAQAYYDRGQYAEGLRALGSGSVPPEWRDATDRLRAAGEEGSGQPKAAAARYERLANGAGPDERAALLADAARAYEAAGDVSDAKRTWQQLIGTGARGATEEARVRLGELEARGG